MFVRFTAPGAVTRAIPWCASSAGAGHPARLASGLTGRRAPPAGYACRLLEPARLRASLSEARTTPGLRGQAMVRSATSGPRGRTAAARWRGLEEGQRPTQAGRMPGARRLRAQTKEGRHSDRPHLDPRPGPDPLPRPVPGRGQAGADDVPVTGGPPLTPPASGRGTGQRRPLPSRWGLGWRQPLPSRLREGPGEGQTTTGGTDAKAPTPRHPPLLSSAPASGVRASRARRASSAGRARSRAAKSSCSKSSAGTPDQVRGWLARAAQAAGFKRCCLSSGRFDLWPALLPTARSGGTIGGDFASKCRSPLPSSSRS
jgi:hypothetical protein